jgi:hypothetical protein
MLLDELVTATSLLSVGVSALTGLAAGYLSVWLKFKDHGNRLDNYEKELARKAAESREHMEAGHPQQSALLRKKIEQEGEQRFRQLQALEARLPNCPAHMAELNSRLEILEAQIQSAMLVRARELVEQFSQSREDLRQQLQLEARNSFRELLPAELGVLLEEQLQQKIAEDRRDIDFLFSALTQREAEFRSSIGNRATARLP